MSRLAEWCDDRLAGLAAWIHPETAHNARRYKELLADLRDVEDSFKKDVPEISLAVNWTLGRNWSRRTSTFMAQYMDHDYVARVYPAYASYPSLVHLRDIITNEYLRKTKK